MAMTRLICLFTLLVSGCAGGNVVECHGVNWYQIGSRDARLGAKDESKTIAESCGPAFNADQYREGFQAGAKK
jgi:hypothetical protein